MNTNKEKNNMDKRVYVLLGQDYDWNDEGEQPKSIVGIYSTYEEAKKDKNTNPFSWDILTIEEYHIYDRTIDGDCFFL